MGSHVAAFIAMFWLVSSCTAEVKPSQSACNVPQQARNLSEPVCTSSDQTLDDARAQAWRFAPRLHFHPLEQYYLQDPSYYFSQAAVYGQYVDTTDPVHAIVDAAASIYPLLALPKSYITILGTANEREVLAGAPFTGNGTSTARVFYSIVDTGNGSWFYTYNLFYSWNGCANMELAVAYNGAYQGVDAYICPIGVHEGDWERVSVTVCKGSTTPSQVTYSQHGWTEVRNCEAGECPFDEDGHPVSYVALNSHANYPVSSPLNIYSLKRLNFLANLDGVYIGDRTLFDSNRTFVPTPDNIVELPDIENITADSVPYRAWALYTGNWGRVPLRNQSFGITCLSNNQTTATPCNPDRLPDQLLQSAVSILSGQNVNNSLLTLALPLGVNNLIASTLNNSFESQGLLQGPWLRDWSFERTPDTVSAPVWGDVNVTSLGARVCPMSGDPSRTARVQLDYTDDNVANYLLGLGIAIVAFSGALALFLILPNCCWWESKSIHLVPVPGAKARERSSMAALLLVPLGRSDALLFRLFWGVSGLALYVTGAVLTGIGINTLFTLLDQLHAWDTWGKIHDLIIAVLAIVGFFDLLAVIIYVFVTTEPAIVLMRNRLHYRNPATRVGCLTHNSRLVHMILFAFIGLVICLCMLLFGLGLLASIAKIIFLNTCERVASVASNSGICLNLQDNGLDLAVCGDRIVDICDRWSRDKVKNIAIGAAFAVWAHLLFAGLSLATFPLTCSYKVEQSDTEGRTMEVHRPTAYLDNPLATQEGMVPDPKLESGTLGTEPTGRSNGASMA